MVENPVLVKLERRESPVPRSVLDKPRTSSGMSKALSLSIKNCCTGKSEWPLFIHGGPGVGKTCAGLVLTDWIEWSYYWDMSEMCRQFAKALCKELYSGGNNPSLMSWDDMMQMIRQSDLVVIDEIGKGLRGRQATDHQMSVLRGVLDARERMATVLISNFPISQCSTIYDPFIASRMGSGTVVSLARMRDRRTG